MAVDRQSKTLLLRREFMLITLAFAGKCRTLHSCIRNMEVHFVGYLIHWYYAINIKIVWLNIGPFRQRESGSEIVTNITKEYSNLSQTSGHFPFLFGVNESLYTRSTL